MFVILDFHCCYKINNEVNLGCTKEFSPRKKTTINTGKKEKIWINKILEWPVTDVS